MPGKTRKRDANDLPEQNRQSLKLVVEACFIRVMLELEVLPSSSISRAIVKYEPFRSISITRIGVRGVEIPADEIYVLLFVLPRAGIGILLGLSLVNYSIELIGPFKIDDRRI